MKFKLICIFLLFLITFFVFQYTLELREPWRVDGLSNEDHQWLTASTVKYSKNWYIEDPISLKFAMLDNPKSIEFNTLSSRKPYTSYPPGTIIPIYIISEIKGSEPTPLLVMDYNLLNHFLIAFLLSLIVFFTFLRLKLDLISAFIFSTIPILLELLLPGPLYWHQNVFFADQAVILPFVSFIFLEIIISSYTKSKEILTALSIFQSIIMFYGILTDWFFIFIAFVVYLKRIFNREMIDEINIYSFLKESLKYWLPAILSLSLFIMQLLYLGTINQTIDKGLLRTGGSRITDFVSKLQSHLFNDYGAMLTGILLISLIICSIIALFMILRYLRNKKIYEDINNTLYIIGILAIPCFLQILTFKDHTFFHEFSVLKFSVLYATIPFVFTPLLLYLVFKHSKFINNNLKGRKINGLLILSLLCLTMVSGLVVYENPDKTNLFPDVNDNIKLLGNSINKNVGYNDIVFSPDFEVRMNPPQIISYSMKRVYKVNSTDEIKEKIKNIEGDYRVVILFLNKPRNWEILDNATLIKDNNYYYYIISPKSLK